MTMKKFWPGRVSLAPPRSATIFSSSKFSVAISLLRPKYLFLSHSLYLSGRFRRQTYGNGGEPQGNGGYDGSRERGINAEVVAEWTTFIPLPLSPSTVCTAVREQSVCPFASRSEGRGPLSPEMMVCMGLISQIRQAIQQYEIINRNYNDIIGIMTSPLILNYQQFLRDRSYQQVWTLRQGAVNRGCPSVPLMPPAPGAPPMPPAPGAPPMPSTP